jgi:hypothetical protein
MLACTDRDDGDRMDQQSGSQASTCVEPARQTAAAHWQDVRRLGLELHVAELDALGYTIVPPEIAGPNRLAERLRGAILDVAERRTGVRPRLEHDSRYANPAVPLGEHFAYLLFEDDVFQEAVLNPVVLTLVTHLLGANAILSNCLAYLKGPGEQDLALHSDNVYMPAPFPVHAQVCNATWLLTDYSRDDGALCFVPGSHQFARHPNPGEALGERVPVTAPAGSLVFWYGHTWHGAFARITPGVRMNLINAFMRMYMRPQEPYGENVTPAQLARRPSRLATLLAQHVGYGWKEEGPDYRRLGADPGKGQTRWY